MSPPYNGVTIVKKKEMGPYVLTFKNVWKRHETSSFIQQVFTEHLQVQLSVSRMERWIKWPKSPASLGLYSSGEMDENKE